MLTAGVKLAAFAAGSIFTTPLAAPPISVLAPPGLDELEATADDVTIDTERRELVLRGNVRVEASPFHLRSQALKLRRSARGIEVEGEGKLAFCPCLGTPLTLTFDDALVGPPSDLVLRKPKLEIYGVPILWLPYFWVRAPDRPGLLPPDVQYRGRDGFFVGAGVHVPWAKLDLTAPRRDPIEAARQRELGLDLRAGAYLKGGFAVDGDLRTPRSRTRLRYDWLDRGGLRVDARGSEGSTRGAAWDVDVMRGRRALEATMSLDEAARPLDRARAETFVREGPVTIATAAAASTLRGTDVARAFGPIATVAISEALGAVGTVSLGSRGGAYRDRAGESTAFAVGEAELGVRRPIGIVATAFDARGEVAVAGSGQEGTRVASSQSTLRFGLPLVRAFASSDSADPWRHRIEPRLAGNALVVSAVGSAPSVARGAVPMLLATAPEGRATGAAALPEVGLASALGRYGARDGFDVDVASGYSLGETRAPVARTRLAAAGEVVGASVEGGARMTGARGVAFSSRVRVGRLDEVHVEGRAGGRVGVDPTLARLLAPGLRDPATAYYAGEGASAGGTLVLPVTQHVTMRGGTDFDLRSGSLLGARGSVDLRDGCGCVTLRLFGSHRLGREGVDLWLALELGEARSRP